MVQLVRGGRVKTGDWMRLSARRHPDRTFLEDAGTGRSFTFREGNERVNLLVDALRRRGVERGDRLAVFATDSHRYIETILASLKMATVIAPLNFRLTAAEAAGLAARTEPRALFVSQQYGDVVAAVRAACPDLSLIVCFDGALEGCIGFEQLLSEAGSADEIQVEVEPEDIVAIGFTSGTTGLPKGVLQSERMLFRSGSGLRTNFHLGDDEVWHTGIPLYHVGGIVATLYTAFAGATYLLTPQFDAPRVLAWMQERMTSTILVPTMISSLLALPGARQASYPHLRRIIYGAAPMSPALLSDAMSVFQCDFYNSFAAGTEGGGSLILTAADHRRALRGEEHLLGSIGRPALNVDLRITDADWNDVPVGTVGEITTKSEGLMSGYLDEHGAAADVVRDGWFRAGDLAYEDDEGYVFLSGRKGDMVIRGGENIYPIEVEQVLAAFPGVRDAVVIGVADDHWGEVLKACIELHADTTRPTTDDLVAHCRRSLAGFKVPELWEFVDELPRNASGKVLKRELISGRTTPA